MEKEGIKLGQKIPQVFKFLRFLYVMCKRNTYYNFVQIVCECKNLEAAVRAREAAFPNLKNFIVYIIGIQNQKAYTFMYIFSGQFQKILYLHVGPPIYLAKSLKPKIGNCKQYSTRKFTEMA